MGLKKVNIKDWRDLAPLEGWARVIKVYDGDTFWLALSPTDPLNLSLLDLEQPEKLRLVNVRLARVNAPEMKGAESAKGKISKQYVESLIADKIVWFSFGNYGLYGGESLDCFHRHIGEISYTVMLGAGSNAGNSLVNLSDTLLQGGYAVPFVPKK